MLTWWALAAAAGAVTVDEVVAGALSHDPALVRAEADVVSAEGRVEAARGIRSDPTIAARLGFGVQQHEASIVQPVSVSGEGDAAARAAEAELRAALAARDRTRLEVAADARRLLIRGIAGDAEAHRAEEVLALAIELRAAAEARLASGDASELHVHLARLEEAAAAADEARARGDLLAAREDLAARTGIPIDAELPVDPMAAAPAGAEVGPRSDLDAARARVEAAEAALERERRGALPPADLGVWAQLQGSGWTVGPSVGLTLPVWRANRDGVAAAAGEAELARADQRSLEVRVDAERAGRADRQRSLERVVAAPDPTPEARAALAGIEAAVAAGEIGAADAAILRGRVLDAWRRGASARALAASFAVDLALSESWTTLLPSP